MDRSFLVRKCLQKAGAHLAPIVFGLVCALSAVPAFAADYYVAKNGSDSNPGTLALPWLTIGKAARTLAAGDTVHVKAGTYNEKVTIRVQGNATAGYITFRNYNNDTVIVDGTGFDLSNPWGGVIEAFGKSYIRIQGFHVQNAYNGTSILISGDTGSHHVQVVNNEVSAHNGTNGIGIRGANLSNVLVDSNEVHHCQTGNWEALRVDKGTTQFVITNNRVHDNSNIGIDVVGWGAPPAYGLVRNNICYRNGLSASGAHGIYVDGGTYVTVEENVCYDNWGGISIGAEYPGQVAHHIIVRRNVVYDNWVRGIAVGSCESCGRPQDCAIVHNVCYDNNGRDSSTAVRVHFFQGAHQVKNNILYQTLGGFTYGYVFMYDADPAETGMVIDYNCEFPASAMYYYQWRRYNTFPEWQAVSGQDAHSFIADPVFVSAATQDFSLQAGSPCIDAGEFLARAVSAGSGTSLVVDDATAFTDGYAGVFPGDVIRVGTQAPVTVAQVDYANDRLVLSQPLDWSANDGVSLVFLGSRPDLGAYEYGMTTTAGVLSGAVSDRDTGETIPGAVLTSGNRSTASDATGGYTLTLPSGNQSITCTMNGYRSQTMRVGILPGETVLLNWRLESIAHESAEFTVSPSIYIRGKSPEERVRFGNLPAEATLRLFTVSGRAVATLQHRSSFTVGHEDWDIRGLASGVYLYHIHTAHKDQRGKIVIVK